MYYKGEGVPQDFVAAVKWAQLAAEQGHANTLKAPDEMQQENLSPTPAPGTAVTAILLSSGKAAKLNKKTGTVVEAPSAEIWSGRALRLCC